MGLGDKAIEEGAGFLSALIKRNVGYSLSLGIMTAIIATATTQFFLSGSQGFVQSAHPKVLISEFFVLWIVVSIVAFLATIRDDEIKNREKEIADREAKLTERNSALNANIVAREEALTKREAELARRETEDLLTPFRRSLEGAWEIEFRRWEYDDKGEPHSAVDIDTARFIVDDDTGKLVIKVLVREGFGFRRDELSIEAISIRPVRSPQTLDYYHKMRLTTDSGDPISGQIFVHLDIVYEREKVIRLEGIWYDLEGKFAAARKNMYVAEGHKPKMDLPPFGYINLTPLSLVSGPRVAADHALAA